MKTFSFTVYGRFIELQEWMVLAVLQMLSFGTQRLPRRVDAIKLLRASYRGHSFNTEETLSLKEAVQLVNFLTAYGRIHIESSSVTVENPYQDVQILTRYQAAEAKHLAEADRKEREVLDRAADKAEPYSPSLARILREKLEQGVDRLNAEQQRQPAVVNPCGDPSCSYCGDLDDDIPF